MNESGEYRSVPLSSLQLSKTNPRELTGDLEGLAASIRERGVLVPLVIRPLSAAGREERYEVVAGERRFHASGLAGLSEVPVRVMELTDEQAREVQIIENLQREDVHPLDEAEGFRALIPKGLEAAGQAAAIEELAGKLGKPSAYVVRRLALLRLEPKAAGAYRGGMILLGHAQLLAGLQPADQVEALAACFHTDDHDGKRVKRQTSVAHLASWIRDELMLDLSFAPWKKDDAELHPVAGACSACPKRTGSAASLFAELAGRDRCTDRKCFEAKMQAHLQRVRADYAARDTRLLEVSTRWNHARPAKGKPLTEPHWKPTGAKEKTCGSAADALMVEGEERGRVIRVCADQKCEKHFGRAGLGTIEDPKARARRLAEKKKQATEARYTRRLFDAIRAKAPAKLGRPELEAVAVAFARRFWADHVKLACEILGLKPEKASRGYLDGRGGQLVRWIRAAKDAELAGFLFWMPMLGVLATGSYSDHRGLEELQETSKKLGIDAAKIRREVEAEAAPRKPRGKPAAADASKQRPARGGKKVVRRAGRR